MGKTKGRKETENWLGELSNLINEASVESFFLDRFIKHIGWEDSQIKLKNSISEFVESFGRTKNNYKPDYILLNDNLKPCIVIDAKSPNEDLHDYIEQCASYCFMLNRPKEFVDYFVLSNGYITELYNWKDTRPIVTVTYEDFAQENEKYSELVRLILMAKSCKPTEIENKKDSITLKRTNKEEAQKLFKKCHKIIWNNEKCGVNYAFMQFVKLIFLKMQSDKAIHEKYNYPKGAGNIVVKKEDILFSVDWIERNTSDFVLNPIKEIQFKKLMEKLDEEVKRKNKKKLFDLDEEVSLKAGTIKKVVEALEHNDLYGIDEDLNGRLFETFLSATMRGNDLGQYFTPRSIVKLGVEIADIKVSKEHIDKVLDGSCGTGGYLIEAFCQMKNKITSNSSLTDGEKEKMLDVLCKKSIYGIDAAKDPMLARIARINMYLHGDGGSQIYMGDALNTSIDKTDSKEFQEEMEDMKDVFVDESFDVVITNPPFSMQYNANDEEQEKVLQQYELAVKDNKWRTLRAGVMFIERYYKLLRKGGKLITVIDNTILNSSDYSFVRDYIRKHFIIKAVISLHGDAFQQSKARVKTSLIYLIKKMNDSEIQPDVFMDFSVALGVDDKPVTTSQTVIENARRLAEEEIKRIKKDFLRFENGDDGIWRVKPEKVKDMLDVKHCIPLQGRFVDDWKKDGFEIKKLEEIFDVVTDEVCPSCECEDEEIDILTIKYDGTCSAEEKRFGRDIKGKGYLVKSGNVVFSRYNAYYGAIGVVSEDFENSFASNSYIVLNPKDEIDGIYAWTLLRTMEIRSDLLDSAIGMGRSTIKWDEIKNVRIPFASRTEREFEANRILKLWNTMKTTKIELEKIREEIGERFGTESEKSVFRFNANKPPK